MLADPITEVFWNLSIVVEQTQYVLEDTKLVLVEGLVWPGTKNTLNVSSKVVME